MTKPKAKKLRGTKKTSRGGECKSSKNLLKKKKLKQNITDLIGCLTFCVEARKFSKAGSSKSL